MKIYLICTYPVLIEGIISMINSNYSDISTYTTFDEAVKKYFSDKDTIFIYPVIYTFYLEFKKLYLLRTAIQHKNY